MIRSPYFSIIVPIYNTEKYLRKCVDSILNQTFTDYEIILVDDGSTDSCPDICDEYSKKDCRVAVIHKENGGLVSARKAGANAAKGFYIANVDSDDWISPDMLLESYKVIEKYNVDVFCFKLCRVYINEEQIIESQCDKDLFEGRKEGRKEGGYYSREEIENKIFPYLIRCENGEYLPYNVCGKIIRSDYYRNAQNQVPDDISIAEDLCVSTVLIYNSNSLYISNKVLYYYRQNNQSMSKNRTKGYSWKSIELLLEHLKKNFDSADMQAQTNRYVVHLLFKTAWSWLRTKEKYSAVKKEIVRNFRLPIYRDAIENCKFSNNLKEKMALFSVKHRAIWLIYIYSIIS